MEKIVHIWTDGACSGNPGAGGWAAVLQFGEHEKEISGYKLETTNNEMELFALMCSLAALNPTKQYYQYVIHTDSKYVINVFDTWIHGWIRANGLKADRTLVANWDIIKSIHNLLAVLDVSFEWVRGHAGDPMNERVDKLAVEQRNLAKEFVKESRKNA